MFYELHNTGLKLKNKKQPGAYKEIKIDFGYRADLIVKDKIVIELKTVDVFNPVYEAQILNYLKFAQKNLAY